MKNQFDVKVENRSPPMIMGLGDWLKKYEDVELKAWEDNVLVNKPKGTKRNEKEIHILWDLLLEGSINISPIRSYAHLQKCPRFYISTYIRKRQGHLVLKEIYFSYVYQIWHKTFVAKHGKWNICKISMDFEKKKS